MTAEEYAVAQAAISTRMVAELQPWIDQFRVPQMNLSLWYQFLRLIFPIIARFRTESAELGRFFYDSQREIHKPQLPRHDIYLADYQLDWFIEAMEPARIEFSKPGASNYSAERIALRALKEVENGGRKTILRPIRNPEYQDRAVVGWARVATGRETCGFCMMLVSRGAVYLSARGAGLAENDTSARELFEKGDAKALDELMTRWHEGCDCKVVPVFDRANWPGRDASIRAYEIWRKVTKGYSGNDALNAFRRAIERGDVDILAMTLAA